MAEVIIPNGYGNAVMSWTHTGLSRPVTVTHGYETLEGGVTAAENAELIYGFWTDPGAPCVAANMWVGWTFQGVYVLQRNLAGNLFSASYEVPISGTGVAADSPQSPYNPLVVSKTTAQAGRRFRGRMYPPIMSGGEVAVSIGGNLESNYLAAVRAQYDAVFFDWNASGSKPVLLHSHPDDEPSPVTGWNVRSVVGTQRRRKNRA